jgi:integrase
MHRVANPALNKSAATWRRWLLAKPRRFVRLGVPISVISKWAGHYDPAFTMKTYVRASDADLKAGARTLARIHEIA